MNKFKLAKLMVKIRDDRDEIAFSNIFDFFAPKLKAYYLQNGVTSQISEELTQDVLSTVWLKSNKYDPSKSALSTWIYTIARNKKIDFLRKNSNIDINEEDIREFLYKDTQTNETEIRDQVEKINDELDTEQRKMIKMKDTRKFASG